MVSMAMCIWFREVPFHVEELCLPRNGESGKGVHSEDRGSYGGPPQLCPHSSSGLPGRDICFSSKGLSHTNPGDDISANPSSVFHRRSLLQGEGTLAPHTGPRSLATLTWFHGFPGGRCSSEDETHPLLLQQEILMNFDVPMVTTLGRSVWWR